MPLKSTLLVFNKKLYKFSVLGEEDGFRQYPKEAFFFSRGVPFVTQLTIPDIKGLITDTQRVTWRAFAIFEMFRSYLHKGY